MYKIMEKMIIIQKNNSVKWSLKRKKETPERNYDIGSLAKWVECLPMARETGVQSLVESYQRL